MRDYLDRRLGPILSISIRRYSGASFSRRYRIESSGISRTACCLRT